MAHSFIFLHFFRTWRKERNVALHSKLKKKKRGGFFLTSLSSDSKGLESITDKQNKEREKDEERFIFP